MKLSEFFESFDTKLDLQWQKRGQYDLTSFTMNGYTIVIQVHNTFLPSEFSVDSLKNAKTAEISFYTITPEGKSTHETFNKIPPTQSLKIFGVIKNALVDKFKEYDAFYFAAEKQFNDYEKKEWLYSNIINKMSKIYSFHQKWQETNTEKLFLASKIPFELNEGNWFSETQYLLSQIIPVDVNKYLNEHKK